MQTAAATTLQRQSFQALPGWAADDHAAALHSFRLSCREILKDGAAFGRPVEFGGAKSDWDGICSQAQQVKDARAFFETQFTPFRVIDAARPAGLFTGYYEPVLYGSLRRVGDFKYPLYAIPAELKDQKPYYSREEIERGRLNNRRLEIVWVDDPVMLFFMQIQGSGRVRLQNGRELRIGYGDQNGHPYVSLGKIMGDEGYLPKDGINFFTIRQWLYEHPSQAINLMQRNPSYVFFKIIDKNF